MGYIQRDLEKKTNSKDLGGMCLGGTCPQAPLVCLCVIMVVVSLSLSSLPPVPAVSPTSPLSVSVLQPTASSQRSFS